MAEAEQQSAEDEDIEARLGINVEIVAVLGSSDMKISQLLKMGRGAVVQLDRHVGDEIEVYANKHHGQIGSNRISMRTAF